MTRDQELMIYRAVSDARHKIRLGTNMHDAVYLASGDHEVSPAIVLPYVYTAVKRCERAREQI